MLPFYKLLQNTGILLLSISLAWSNLNGDSMFSDNDVEWAVSDEGSIARFDLSACLDSESFQFSTHFLLEGLGEVNGNDFR